MNQVILDLQLACKNRLGIPNQKKFHQWVTTTLVPFQRQKSEVTVRLIDEEESCRINFRYRGKEKPTNVLSFPYNLPFNIPLIGDLLICKQVVEYESLKQQKSLEAHWAHMTIHGTLHLMGCNHIKKDDAEEMEKVEKNIMLNLGYPDPYNI